MADVERGSLPTVDLKSGGVTEVRASSAFDPPSERFATVAELGRGGMGRVDDAFDRALGRPVAIKHMLSTDDVALARFEREARITARLEHPGIVPIHDAGRGADGTPYYVMRRIDGEPLEALLGTTLADRLALIPNVLAACDAVAFAHARGIVHRDIKPTNILVGPFGETLVIDWGLAREIDERDAGGSGVIPPSDPNLTRAGAVAGTPGFMAPEQARGEAVDARADVFALGATLFFVLAGKLPYGEASATEMVDFASAGREPEWRALPDDAPPELRAIAEKAMSNAVDERYLDAGALAADLRRFVTGNLVDAYRYGVRARLWRLVRRHRAAVAVAVVSAIVVVTIGLLSLRRIVAERDEATSARAIAEVRQHDATSMADRMLVQHARELADSDPAAALVVLQTLPAESTRWREAWTAAAAAFMHGIPFGFSVGAGATFVEIQRDSRHALVLDWLPGKVAVIDLIARTRRMYSFPPHVTAATWLGPTHFVLAYLDHLVVVDSATGATRNIPVPLKYVNGDHDSRIWITTEDHQLLELTDPAGEPRLLVKGFDEISVSPDLDEAVIRRGDTLDVWSPAHTIRIVDHAKQVSSLVTCIRKDLVSTLVGDVLSIWRIDGDKLVPDGVITGRTIVQVSFVHHRVLATNIEGTTTIQDGRTVGFAAGQQLTFNTPSGIVQVAHDGSLRLLDSQGWFTIDRHAGTMRRADESADERFVVATTDAGDALIWDLAPVRPRMVPIDGGDAFVRLSDRYLWTNSMISGVNRIDLATGAKEHMLDGSPRGIPLVGGNDQSIAMLTGDELQIRDLTSHRDIVEPARAVTWDGESGIVIEHVDGTLSRWLPGAMHSVPYGTLDVGGADGLDATSRYVAATYGDHVARLDLVTHQLEHDDVKNVTGIGILTTGETWLLTNDRALYRWPIGGHAVQLGTSPVDGVSVDDTGVLLYTHKAITLLAGDERHVVAIDSTSYSWAGGPIVAATRPSDGVLVVDMITGLSYRVPSADNSVNVLARGRRAVSNVGTDVMIWNVGVPEEPAALRAWLATATNAQRVPDSEAYTWP